ncbi:MAG TPA: 3-keto-5-aminohexanoate cleavage protein [Steroidobacter sp.]|uniref:3-keto-5-aminohexanoate cleavage protein n=1 Tax=Steroidobacter sp. TaxID=1978227 RepID=UPI002ED800E6
MTPTIISCAVTGGGDTVGKHPAIPVKPAEIAEAAIGAARAGAAIVHIHVRDPATGSWSMSLDLYREVVNRIRDSGTDVLINLTTGVGCFFFPGKEDPGVPGPGTCMCSPYERVCHVLELRPDICSLDLNTMWINDRAIINPPEHIAEMAQLIRSVGVIPELEVFDSGDVHLGRKLIDSGVLQGPGYFQIVLGLNYGASATTRTLMYMRELLPPDAVWGAFGIARHSYPMLMQSFLLGGHVRVGLEDNLYLKRGVLAPDNAAMVRKAVDLITALDGEPATPAQARAILGVRRG